MEYLKESYLRNEEIYNENKVLEEIEVVAYLETLLRKVGDYILESLSLAEFEKEHTLVKAFLWIKHYLLQLGIKPSIVDEILAWLHRKLLFIHDSLILEKVPLPSSVVVLLAKKLHEEHPPIHDLKSFISFFARFLEEHGWKLEFSVHMRVIFSLRWASLIENGIVDLPRIAVRNLLETLLWHPIVPVFMVDPDCFIVKQYSILHSIRMWDKAETIRLTQSKLARFNYQFTKKVYRISRDHEGSFIDRDRFLLKLFPRLICEFIEKLLSDIKEDNIGLFSEIATDKEEKKRVMEVVRTTDLIEGGTIEEFAERFNAKRFRRKIQEAILQGIYYPMDCVTTIEERSEKFIVKLTGIRNKILERWSEFENIPLFY